MSANDDCMLADPERLGKTEWEDALIKHGIMNAPEQKATADDEYLAQVEAYQNRDKLADLTLDQLSDLEDDVEEEELALYRARRLAQMKLEAEKKKFTGIRGISKKEFVPEVNEAGKGVWVFLHLYIEGERRCHLLDECMQVLSKKHKHIKFLKILGPECIDNYPAANCPTVLLYRDNQMVLQVVGLDQFGGMKMTPDSLEWVLANIGVCETKQKRNPLAPKSMIAGDDAHSQRVGQGRDNRNENAQATSALSSDEEEDRGDEAIWD